MCTSLEGSLSRMNVQLAALAVLQFSERGVFAYGGGLPRRMWLRCALHVRLVELRTLLKLVTPSGKEGEPINGGQRTPGRSGHTLGTGQPNIAIVNITVLLCQGTVCKGCRVRNTRTSATLGVRHAPLQ